MTLGCVFAHNFKVHTLTTTNNDTLAAGTDLPASGSFVDVSPYERFHIILRFGAIHASDTPVIEPKESDSVSGTLDQISSTLQHTAEADDDNEYVVWTIETRKLSTDHHFIALDVISGVGNGSYADAFLVGEVLGAPVTQTVAVLPAASQYEWCG